jgi:Ser/Thr protein kinase RdoA (MazF antagonist)
MQKLLNNNICQSSNLKEILNNFYGIKPKSIKKIPYGYTNVNYLIISGNGKKYIARFSPLYREKRILLESYILKKLNGYKLGFLVPKIITTLSNEYFKKIGNYILTLFQYIEGSIASKLRRSLLNEEDISCELGKLVGILHNAFCKIKIPKTKFTHLELINSYTDKFNSYFSNLDSEWKQLLFKERAYLIREISKYKKYYTNFKLPQTFIHTDIRLDNIVLQNRNRKILALLDFNDVLIGDQAFDPASIFVEVYADHNVFSKKLTDFVNIEGYKKFINEYTNVRKIENRKSFIKRVITLLNLQALQVLSIVGRDPDFNEKLRVKNVIWYSNFFHSMNNEKNIAFLKAKMKNFTKN